MKEVIIALRCGIIIHYIDICLCIVVIHLIVPCHSIDTPNEATVKDWEFPILTVIDLSSTRQDYR